MKCQWSAEELIKHFILLPEEQDLLPTAIALRIFTRYPLSNEGSAPRVRARSVGEEGFSVENKSLRGFESQLPTDRVRTRLKPTSAVTT